VIKRCEQERNGKQTVKLCLPDAVLKIVEFRKTGKEIVPLTYLSVGGLGFFHEAKYRFGKLFLDRNAEFVL
jgi:hypothetical protein